MGDVHFFDARARARGTNSIQLGPKGNMKEEDFSVPTPPLVLALARSICLKWDTVIKLIRGCGTSTETRHSVTVQRLCLAHERYTINVVTIMCRKFQPCTCGMNLISKNLEVLVSLQANAAFYLTLCTVPAENVVRLTELHDAPKLWS